MPDAPAPHPGLDSPTSQPEGPHGKGQGSLYQRVAAVLRTRILHGDYSLKPIPSERKLAEEFGINFMTVRRSLRLLESEGFLERQPNGRLSVRSARNGNGHHASKPHVNLAMLMPAGTSPNFGGCLIELNKAAAEFSYKIRPVLYSHWNDPALLDSISTFDGVFLYPFEDEPPASVIEQLRMPAHPVVVLDHDFSGYGIPSLQFFPPIFVQKLLDHLEKEGHTRIGCLNTQSSNAEIRARIEQWRFWMTVRGYEGRLVDEPVELHGSTEHKAYSAMRRLLEQDRGQETAWLCVTRGGAMGIIRAMADLGIRAGTDLAVCAVNGEGLAELLVPSVTALEQPNMTPILKYALRWMTSEQSKWTGPMLTQPPDAELVIRESTRRGAPTSV